MSTTPPPGYGPPPDSGPPPGYAPPPGYPPPGYGQPGSAPPAYGQQYGPPPGYGPPYGPPPGPPPMGPVTTQFARIDPGPSQAFGVVGAAVAVVGAVLLVVAFTAVSWFSGDGGTGGSSSFSNVHQALDQVPGLREVTANAYFSWLGWVLLVVAVGAALVANVPTIGPPFRVIAPIVALGSIVVTFVAIKLLKDSDQLGSDYQGYTTYLKHASTGFYLAVAGFVLVGVGALIGPRNRRG
jgi:hypothetical protein